MAFTTIYVPEDLGPREHRVGVAAGPWQVATRRPYPELVTRAGFEDVVEVDVSDDFLTTQRSWSEQNEAHADTLRQLTSEEDFELAQLDRRRALDAITAGLLKRSLFSATVP
jgi:hypothetical protein